jgi:IclR family pca regulon transcriptional regulator
MAERSDLERYRIASLGKGLQVLRQIAAAPNAVAATELASSAGIPLATVYRLVATLELEGYLTRTDGGLYRPALSNLELGFASLRASGLVGVASDLIRDLSVRTGETANLGVLQRDQVIYLVRVQNTDLVTAHITVGSTLPAVSTSIGKLLLAQLADNDLEACLNRSSFSGTGPNAVKSLAALKLELERIRQAGWALQNEEVAKGLRSVAAPVRDANGKVVAGVNVAVPAADHPLESVITSLLPEVLATGARISRLLGYVP